MRGNTGYHSDGKMTRCLIFRLFLFSFSYLGFFFFFFGESLFGFRLRNFNNAIDHRWQADDTLFNSQFLFLILFWYLSWTNSRSHRVEDDSSAAELKLLGWFNCSTEPYKRQDEEKATMVRWLDLWHLTTAWVLKFVDANQDNVRPLNMNDEIFFQLVALDTSCNSASLSFH